MNEHQVIFYEQEQGFLSQVADFLGAGLAQGDACVVIATEAHRDAIATELGRRGALGKHASGTRVYRALDAGEMLSRYMSADWPQPDKFTEVIEPVLAEASQGGRRPLRLFGEMVAMEFEAGNQEAAIRIEELWNALGERHRFSLLCAYPIGQASRMRDYTSLIRICAEHNKADLPAGLWVSGYLEAAPGG